ncbi:hypothetical protein HYH02_006931 [Chlamydomonas schloesseri]|uniref:Uncharacterized protein n=1 Tax=Chlamydomonas schloesseri TaxID=2026947 RepID=A0A835WIM6_9CHLO|nr:hypothetical protein HYH02_006931 [Chlamydomonas schloesseri]|eukprot:KAG2448349.1 hypothetical protein HYH02_006931 [Chlamydomonas schloesseri]
MDASAKSSHVPFIRGLVLSSTLVHGCEALRKQLQLLVWGGLRVAELRGPGQASEPGAVPAGVDVLELSDGADGGGGGSSSAASSSSSSSSRERAVQAWAEGHGLRWPSEVVVLAPGAGQQEEAEGDGEVLPGFRADAAQDAPWPRLRLALAHANLRRAQAAASAGLGAASTSGRKRAREEEGERQGAEQEGGKAGAGPAHGGDLTPPAGGPSGSAAAPERSSLVVVGYAMKASREADLAKEGLLNLVPQDGVVFAPLDLSQALAAQLPFHCILHKASDELEYGPPPSPPPPPAAAPRAGDAADGPSAAETSLLVPRFGPRVRAMAEFVSRQGGRVSLVDPLEATAKVINRTELARVCDSLSQVELQGAAGGAGVVVRAPRHVTVSAFEPAQLAAALEQLGCSAPFIVKPVVACGTPDSHAMALVLWPEALGELAGRVPLPAVVQEFVNHDATIYKVYAAGDKVFHTVRPSIPNVPQTRPDAEALAPNGVLTFDSLKSLPTTLPSAGGSAATAAAGVAGSATAAATAAAAATSSFTPSQEVLERLAAHLRSALGLSLFGFDVVVSAGDQGLQEGQGGQGGQAMAGDGGCGKARELVVVDVNYFPSYRGAKGAPTLFRAAVLGAHRAQVPA